MEKWKVALKDFLSEYEENDDVIGALLCGSYAAGNETPNSDIDVYLVLKDDVNYRKRGNTESNSYLIEYFMNPVWKIKEYMNEEHDNNELATANMFAYGKILYDLDGSVKELQDLALEYIDRPFNNIGSCELDMNNYHIWDYLDELKTNLEENNPQFNLTYYKLLYEIYDMYSKYLGIGMLPKTKIYKILTDFEFRKKYHIFNLPEEEFVKLFVRCFEIDKPSTMYKNISNLVDYYYTKIGGFNIRTFELESDL